DFDLPLREAVWTLRRLDNQWRHFRNDVDELPTQHAILRKSKQVERRPVAAGHDAGAVDAQNAGRDSGQHCIREASPSVELFVGRDQFAALLLDLARHAVKGARKLAELI